MKTKCNTLLFISSFYLFILPARAQDTIFKINGDKIPSKVIQLDSINVVYKKQAMLDGPLFIDKLTEVERIRFADGKEQIFEQKTTGQPKTNTVNSVKQNVANNLSQYDPDNHFIVHTKKKRYTIDNEPSKLKDVNRLLERSQRPEVKLALKGAKTVRVVEKIISFTSIGASSTGSIASIGLINNAAKKFRAGSIKPVDWWGMGLSLFGTMAFPITSKILKNYESKLYDKVIDVYNAKNTSSLGF